VKKRKGEDKECQCDKRVGGSVPFVRPSGNIYDAKLIKASQQVFVPPYH
jgi:hypothetical protein